MRSFSAGLAALFLGIGLSACAGPMAQGEAQRYAATRISRYCDGACGRLQLVKSQRMTQGWLVDFDGAQARYGVLVQDDGNYEISVWSKASGASAR